MNKLLLKLTIIILTILFILPFNSAFNLQVESYGQNPGVYKIYENNELHSQFNNSEYSRMLSCKNGELKIIQYQKGFNTSLIFSFQGLQNGDFLKGNDILIDAKSNPAPKPTLNIYSPGVNGFFLIDGNCPQQPTNQNYFNQIIFSLIPRDKNGNQLIQKKYQWSLLLNCDSGNRHKKFQIGYLVLALGNMSIIIGVALYSRIWSIRFRKRPLNFQLNWILFVCLQAIILIVALILYFFTENQILDNGTLILRYIGLVASFFFTFICLNQAFFLIGTLKSPVYKFIRICDIVSIIGTFGIITLGALIDNWIVTNILAGMICVGSIKMLKFKTLLQSIICMLIYVVSVTLLASILHFSLKQSYNDYASQLSSPLFLQFPDLVNNLYKKCSWLPVFEVIIPGVMLSFLRSYDQNFNTGWGGVYTVIGNAAFVISTVIWVAVQYFYPFSVPFALVTYSLTLLSIIILAFKRNQLNTLLAGSFNTDRTSRSYDFPQKNQNFANMIDQDILKASQIQHKQSLIEDQQK